MIIVMHDQRCSICNNVSNPEIATFEEEYVSGLSFYEVHDRNPPRILCSLCLDPVNDVEELEDVASW